MTTKEQLDAALATADQITVEGDDELLSYATSRASNDRENRVSVEIDEHPIMVTPPAPSQAKGLESDSARLADEAEFQALLARSYGPAKKRRGGWRVLYVACLFVLGLAISAYLLLGVERGPLPQALPPSPEVALTPSNYIWTNVPSLMWPLVAIVAIVALFLIARQAIASGSNVTITWKVTDKVAGRVVITKVRERTTKSRATA